MKMKPTLIILLLLAVSAVALSACVSQVPPASTIPPAPVMKTIKIAFIPLVSNGPLFIAKEEGYFAQEGINVEFEKFQSVAASLPALINGDIAVTGGPLMPGIINSVAKNASVRIVAEKGKIARDYCNVTAIVVRRDLFETGKINKVTDLKGRKVMATSDQQYTLFRSLALGNLTTDDVEIIEMDYPSSLLSLKNQAIDAGILTEPYVTQAVNSGAGVVLVPAQDYIPDFPYLLYYGPAILDKDPELGKRFMVAYLKGVKQYNTGKTERNLEILQNYTKLDREFLKQSCWVKIEENGSVSENAVREYMDWMYANKKITQNLNNDQMSDMSYVNYANGVLKNSTVGKTP